MRRMGQVWRAPSPYTSAGRALTHTCRGAAAPAGETPSVLPLCCTRRCNACFTDAAPSQHWLPVAWRALPHPPPPVAWHALQHSPPFLPFPPLPHLAVAVAPLAVHDARHEEPQHAARDGGLGREAHDVALGDRRDAVVDALKEGQVLAQLAARLGLGGRGRDATGDG